MNHELKMIELYDYVCNVYNEDLCWNVQRFSNNGLTGYITDEEIITIYMYCMLYEEKYQIKSMHTFIKRYWSSWFPKLPSYQTFNKRLNRLSDALNRLLKIQMENFSLPEDKQSIMLGDSFPIITCSHKRRPKVALNLINKGFCATKDLHYYGVKLHAMGLKREKTLPYPQFLDFSLASVHDLTAIRPVFEHTAVDALFMDKAYCDTKIEADFERDNSKFVTPIKLKKGEAESIRQFDKAHNDLFNTAVSMVRQPIESFFNWINQLTHIQNASKVRSENGLLVHIFGRLSSALYKLSEA